MACVCAKVRGVSRAGRSVRSPATEWWPLVRVWMAPVHDGFDLEHEKGIRWMPWHQEAMKDVARCAKPRGAASRR